MGVKCNKITDETENILDVSWGTRPGCSLCRRERLRGCGCTLDIPSHSSSIERAIETFP